MHSQAAFLDFGYVRRDPLIFSHPVTLEPPYLQKAFMDELVSAAAERDVLEDQLLIFV